jgi:hypothetical protein
MRRTAELLRADGVEAVFVSLHREGDGPALAQLKREDLWQWDPRSQAPGEFVAELAARFSLVVSARAHGIMLAAVAGVPGICAVIEPKLENVHRMLPESTRAWRAPFSPVELRQCVLSMLTGRQRLAAQARRETLAQMAIARAAADDLQQWLVPPRP